jgi:hypothetical protein
MKKQKAGSLWAIYGMVHAWHERRLSPRSEELSNLLYILSAILRAYVFNHCKAYPSALAHMVVLRLGGHSKRTHKEVRQLEELAEVVLIVFEDFLPAGWMHVHVQVKHGCICSIFDLRHSRTFS